VQGARDRPIIYSTRDGPYCRDECIFELCSRYKGIFGQIGKQFMCQDNQHVANLCIPRKLPVSTGQPPLIKIIPNLRGKCVNGKRFRFSDKVLQGRQLGVTEL
jgi:hypothetical protein